MRGSKNDVSELNQAVYVSWITEEDGSNSSLTRDERMSMACSRIDKEPVLNERK